MWERPTIEVSEARQDGLYLYFRVYVNGVEQPSLIFVKALDRTVYGENALREWCERSLDRLESGKVIEAIVSTDGAT